MALGREGREAWPAVGREGVERTTVTGAGVKDSGSFGGSEIARACTPVSSAGGPGGFSSAPVGDG